MLGVRPSLLRKDFISRPIVHGLLQQSLSVVKPGNPDRLVEYDRVIPPAFIRRVGYRLLLLLLLLRSVQLVILRGIIVLIPRPAY